MNNTIHNLIKLSAMAIAMLAYTTVVPADTVSNNSALSDDGATSHQASFRGKPPYKNRSTVIRYKRAEKQRLARQQSDLDSVELSVLDIDESENPTIERTRFRRRSGHPSHR